MVYLIWTGAALSLLGVGLLLWCIRLAMTVRGAGLDEDTRRIRLRKVVMVNVGALGVSGIGLMMVVIGIFLE